MRDLQGKLDRLEELLDAGQITRRFALERAAAMGEYFERESHAEDLAEAVLEARRAIGPAVHRARREAHLRCEALLLRWLHAEGVGVDDRIAEALREKLRTSRPSLRVESTDPAAPLFDLSDLPEYEQVEIALHAQNPNRTEAP
jgi:uncharacterized protein (DUF4415 family)